MEMINLERFAYTPFGVFGKLAVKDFECFTVERPWLDNKPNVSCIPSGLYQLKLGKYNKGGYPAYEVMNVPGRTHIKIHIGNTIDDVIGCIAPGTSLGYVNNKWAVSFSKEAFNQFMAVMKGMDQPQLKISQYQA